MSIFQNLRTRAIKQKWDAFFERSGKFASAFVDTTKLLDFEAVTVTRLPGDRGLIEHHGSIESVGKALRHELVSLGIMQDGPGAPKGNQNAVGAVHDEKAKRPSKKRVASQPSKNKLELEQAAKQAAMEVGAGGKKRLAARESHLVFNTPLGPSKIRAPKSEIVGLAETKVQTAIDRVVESTKALDVALNPPRTVTLQSTTKLVDGKLSTSVAKTWVGAAARAALPPEKKRSHHKLTKATGEIKKRSHHKKPLANDAAKPKRSRSHHKKKAA